jgi:hypothetical protein
VASVNVEEVKERFKGSISLREVTILTQTEYRAGFGESTGRLHKGRV